MSIAPIPVWRPADIAAIRDEDIDPPDIPETDDAWFERAVTVRLEGVRGHESWRKAIGHNRQTKSRRGDSDRAREGLEVTDDRLPTIIGRSAGISGSMSRRSPADAAVTRFPSSSIQGADLSVLSAHDARNTARAFRIGFRHEVRALGVRFVAGGGFWLDTCAPPGRESGPSIADNRRGAARA